jgi:hypothetical protein
VVAGLSVAALLNEQAAGLGGAVGVLPAAPAAAVLLNPNGKPQRRCGKCKLFGHNARTCNAAAAPAGGAAVATGTGAAGVASQAAALASGGPSGGRVAKPAAKKRTKKLRALALDDDLLQLAYVPPDNVRRALTHHSTHTLARVSLAAFPASSHHPPPSVPAHHTQILSPCFTTASPS